MALAGIISLSSLQIIGAEPGKPMLPRKPAEFFNVTNVWTVQLKFTSEQWDAMEPKGGGGMLFGGRGGPEGRRGAFPGPGGRGGPGAIREGIILAPSLMQAGDQNQDRKLSKEEFRALAEKLFTEWDKEKRGKLNADQVGAGISSTLIQLPLPPPPGGPREGRGPAIMIPLGPEGRRNGLAGAAGVEYPYVHADFEFEGQVLKDVGMRYKGNSTFMSSRGSLKRPLKADLNKYVKGQKLAGVSKLNFRNNVMDGTWMNEVLSYQLFRDAGVPASRTAYARVYATVPGKYNKEYLGLYSVIEDIDNTFAKDRFGTKKGAIFKPATRDPFAYRGEDWARYKPTYDPKTELSEKEIRRVIEFAKLVTSASDAEFAARLGEFLDLDEFARFMAVTVWLPTLDSILGPGHNYFIYLHPKTHKFQFLPWDLDHSFGQFGMMGGQAQSENLSIHKPWGGESRFLERVFSVDAFKKLYLAKLDEFSKAIFQPDRIQQLVDETAAAIRPAIREESAAKLARFERLVSESAPNAGEVGDFLLGPGRGIDGPRVGGPGRPLKAFVKARAQSVKDQVAGKSEGQIATRFGPGGPGGRGGRGGPAAFGVGGVFGRAFVTALDSNQDGEITHDEFARGFAKWFESWNTDRTGLLTEEQLGFGLGRDLLPFGGRLPGGPGFGPPGGPPFRE